MIQTNTFRSEVTDGHSYNCDTVIMGMGKNKKQDKLFQAKVSHMTFQGSVPPI